MEEGSRCPSSREAGRGRREATGEGPAATRFLKMSMSLHLQTGKDEWSDRFRVVAPNFLADVVGVRAIAIGIAAKACARDGVVDVYESVLIHFDELVQQAFVSPTADVRVLFIDVSQSRAFEQDER